MANELINVVTPVGELHFVNIAGQGKKNYNEDGYEYTATIYLEGEKAKALRNKLDAVLSSPPKGKTLKGKGYKELLVDEEGNLYSPDKAGKVYKKVYKKVDEETVDEETVDEEKVDITAKCKPSGIWAFAFKTGTTFPEDKDGNVKTKVINVYNCAKPPQKVRLGERKVGNGSKGAISGKMRMYERAKEYGISLFLSAIQLTNFKEYEGDAGFEEQEGDFYGVDEDGASFEAAEESAVEAPTEAKAKPKL